MLREGDSSRAVAVKVRHPGVARRIKQDFQLLIPLARYTSRFKALKARLSPLAGRRIAAMATHDPSRMLAGCCPSVATSRGHCIMSG